MPNKQLELKATYSKEKNVLFTIEVPIDVKDDQSDTKINLAMAVDRSGSMDRRVCGSKTQANVVTEAFSAMLDYLLVLVAKKAQIKLTIITFDNIIEVPCNERIVTPEMVAEIKLKLSNWFKPRGGTNIGLPTEMVKKMKAENPNIIAGILSDGKHVVDQTGIMRDDLMKNYSEIFTFAGVIGNRADGALLTAISANADKTMTPEELSNVITGRVFGATATYGTNLQIKFYGDPSVVSSLPPVIPEIVQNQTLILALPDYLGYKDGKLKVSLTYIDVVGHPVEISAVLTLIPDDVLTEAGFKYSQINKEFVNFSTGNPDSDEVLEMMTKLHNSLKSVHDALKIYPADHFLRDAAMDLQKKIDQVRCLHGQGEYIRYLQQAGCTSAVPMSAGVGGIGSATVSGRIQPMVSAPGVAGIPLDSICIICRSEKPTVMFNCNDILVCQTCAPKTIEFCQGKCPKCRRDINRVREDVKIPKAVCDCGKKYVNVIYPCKHVIICSSCFNTTPQETCNVEDCGMKIDIGKVKIVYPA